MIKNELQYRVTKAQVEKFERALAEVRERPRKKMERDPALRKLFEDSLGSQLDDLRDEVEEYERLRSAKTVALELKSLDDLPRVLVQARISAGLTQRELADRLHVKEQQIQRYEATEYASASLSRLSEVAEALGLRLKERAIFEPTVARRETAEKRPRVGWVARKAAAKKMPARAAAAKKLASKKPSARRRASPRSSGSGTVAR